MNNTNRVFGIFAMVLCSLSGLLGCQSGGNGPEAYVQEAGDNAARLAGTWRYETSDAYSFQKITLVLRRDRTYTKTLEARVNGAPYGGTHSGTWTANGTVVNLSGDGNWPAFSHDLALFHKD